VIYIYSYYVPLKDVLYFVIIVIVIVVKIILYHPMQGIYSYIPETKHFSTFYNVSGT